MLDRLVASTNAIYISQDRDSLFEAVNQACRSFKFDSFLLFCHKATKQDMILNATLTDIDGGFFLDYEHFEWSEDDVMLDSVLKTDMPVVWNTAQVRYQDMRKQSYVDFLHASSMRTGVAIPLSHRPGTHSAFSMVSETPQILLAGTIQAATVIANAAMTKAEVLGLCPEISAEEAQALNSLTTIQREILNWIAEGKSNHDISTIVGLNERAVRYHVTEILRKLGVATRMQAATVRRSLPLDPKP